MAKIRLGPAGIHLFDRSSGANVLVDDVRVPPEYWATAPRYVSVALTNACDLTCPFCYAPKHAATLDKQRLASWLCELDAAGCLGVGFGGGEPTLYPGFADLCRTITANTRLAVTFTTHANRIDKHLAAELRQNVQFIRVSMDGVGPTYERLRGTRFDTFLDSLEIVRAISPIGINYVVNARTLPDLDCAITIASKVGAVEFLLLPEQPTHQTAGIDEATALALRTWVTSYSGLVPLRISESGAAGMPVYDPLSLESGLSGYAHIDASGVVKRTSFDTEGVAIGTQSVAAALSQLACLPRSLR